MTGSSIGPFVQAVWGLIGDGKRPSVADDTVGNIILRHRLHSDIIVSSSSLNPYVSSQQRSVLGSSKISLATKKR